MKKIVKKWSDSLVIVLDKEDQQIHNIKEGDIIDMSDMTVIKPEQEDAGINLSNITAKLRNDQNGLPL